MSELLSSQAVGLIGWPVEHSLSPAMQNAAFAACGLDWRYELWPTPIETLAERVAGLRQAGVAGANVTVPHKTAVLPLLDKVQPGAAAVGAVNTIVHDGLALIGYNTDLAGFRQALAEAGGVAPGGRAVVLGAGGAARAACAALQQQGIPVLVLARRMDAAHQLADDLGAHGPIGGGPLAAATLRLVLRDAALLVNATSVGMWPTVDESPLPPGVALPPGLLVYDLVYRPRPTRLLAEAAAAGCRTLDGLGMLLHQGAAAFTLWTGQPAPLAVMRAALERAMSDE
jgi:shikimate dehydrogenase